MMFKSKKDLETSKTLEVLEGVEKALRCFLEVETGYQDVQLRGLSITASKQGEGYLAILKLTLGQDSNPADLGLGLVPGHYVVYGFGDDVLHALANLEAKLELGEATLSPDKYAPVDRPTKR